MHTITKTTVIGLLSALLLINSSCQKDDPIETTESKPSIPLGKYILAFRALGSGDESTDYLITSNNLMSGELSVQGQGLEQTEWRSYVKTGGTVYSIGYGDNSAVGYSPTLDGTLQERGRFRFEKTLDVVGTDRGKIIAIEVPRSGTADRVFHLIDNLSISIKKKVYDPIFTGLGDTIAVWPTSVRLRDDNKLFVSFYPVHADGSFSTPHTDTAYVAVYSYPNLTPEKIIKDDRMGPLGIYGSETGLVKTENGDLYGYSSNSLACGYTQQTKTSGILRILNGTTEFDDTYFFDVENAANGGKINWMEYIGDGKAVARIVTDDSQKWGAYGIDNPILKLVILDLENKTVTNVSGVPLHGGQYSAPVLVENGKFFMSITTASDAYVYQIDPTTATGVKGAKILGQELQGIYKAF